MKRIPDRISTLPDEVLHYILSLLPLKSAIKTCTLSKIWIDLWKCRWNYASIMDFGEEFSNGLSQEQFVDVVHQFLQHYNGQKIKRFRLFFRSKKLYFSNIEQWVEFAITRGVEEVDLDFCQDLSYFITGKFTYGERPFKLPNCLFSCQSLTLLSLSSCIFHPPLNFSGFSSLKTLCLRRVNIMDNTLEKLISTCPLLEKFTMRECGPLNWVKICGPHLRLKSLTLDNCWPANEIEIFAPSLKSLQLFGFLCIRQNFGNISSLEDVIVSLAEKDIREAEQLWVDFLSDLSHVKTMTVFTGPIMSETCTPIRNFIITFYNLKELKLMMESAFDNYLADIYTFFSHCTCPQLEKLSIEFSSAPEDESICDFFRLYVDKPLCVFDCLKRIILHNFHGHYDEMTLARFLLERAVVLESLVLVSPKSPSNSLAQSSENTSSVHLEFLQQELALFSKASSDANIVITCEYLEDDSS